MPDWTLTIDGVEVPRFLYGTAWKEDRTQRLAELALRHGFRGIDTANQRRHYHEAAVGKAISESIASGLVVRDDLFLQTKFTFRRGQDGSPHLWAFSCWGVFINGPTGCFHSWRCVVYMRSLKPSLPGAGSGCLSPVS